MPPEGTKELMVNQWLNSKSWHMVNAVPIKLEWEIMPFSQKVNATRAC